MVKWRHRETEIASKQSSWNGDTQHCFPSLFGFSNRVVFNIMFADDSKDIFLSLFANPLWTTWITINALVTVIGLWILTIPNWVPNYVLGGMLFGKLAPQNPSKILRLIQIPKQWFTHFYAFATLFNAINLTIVFRLYIMQSPVPACALTLLNFVVPGREVTIDTFATLLSMMLIFIQTARRLYECIFISVYSNAKINLLQYFLGFLFYFSVTTTLLSEAPGFSLSDSRCGWVCVSAADILFEVESFGWICYFLFASLMHYQSHVILGNLRKNTKGDVVTTAHLIPVGLWFEYISCPHYLAEILIYIAIFTILGFTHYGWSLVLYWVIFSQVFAGLMTHRWYKQKHKSYPAKRKAIIPFVL
uniref:Polyprenal reductase n=1 Tax=Strigamia maritima TaxID=126957 RepID=T1IR64_STRMM